MSKRSILARTAVGAGAAAMSLAALLAAPSMAFAQSSVDVPVPPRSDAPPPQSSDRSYDDRGYAQQQGSNAQTDRDYQRQRAEYDRRYAEWARENCHAQNGGSTAFGAIAGGILGAVVGSQLSGRGDRTAGSLIGGGLGAVAGGAIGSSAGNNCDNRGYGQREAYGYDQAPPPPAPSGGYGPPPAGYAPPPGAYYEAPGPYYYGTPAYYGPAYYGPAYYGPPVGFGVVIGGGRRWGHRW